MLRDLSPQPSAERATIRNGDNVRTVAFSADGTLLASGGRDGLVRLWRPSGHLTRTLNLGEPINAVAFDGSGNYVAARVDCRLHYYLGR